MPIQLNSQCYCLCLYGGLYNTSLALRNVKENYLVTKEIRFFHVRVLLTLLKKLAILWLSDYATGLLKMILTWEFQ